MNGLKAQLSKYSRIKNKNVCNIENKSTTTLQLGTKNALLESNLK